jgi:hypothetical protein
MLTTTVESAEQLLAYRARFLWKHLTFWQHGGIQNDEGCSLFDATC